MGVGACWGGGGTIDRSRAKLFYGRATVWQCGSMAGPLYGSMAGPLYGSAAVWLATVWQYGWATVWQCGSMAGLLYGSMTGPLYGSMAGHCVRATLWQSYCTAWLQHGDWSSAQYTLCT